MDWTSCRFSLLTLDVLFSEVSDGSSFKVKVATFYKERVGLAIVYKNRDGLLSLIVLAFSGTICSNYFDV